MKSKLFPLITLLFGVLSSAVGLILPLFIIKNHASDGVDIIGGADTPTYANAIWQMGGLPVTLILLGAALLLSGLFCLIFTKTVKNSCSLKTSAIALSLSVFGGTGIACTLLWFVCSAFGERSSYPIAYPASTAGMLVSFVVFISLIMFYCIERHEIFSVKGFLIDVSTSIIYLPFCTIAACYGIEFLSMITP